MISIAEDETALCVWSLSKEYSGTPLASTATLSCDAAVPVFLQSHLSGKQLVVAAVCDDGSCHVFECKVTSTAVSLTKRRVIRGAIVAAAWSRQSSETLLVVRGSLLSPTFESVVCFPFGRHIENYVNV